jgi:hypothetical protein
LFLPSRKILPRRKRCSKSSACPVSIARCTGGSGAE